MSRCRSTHSGLWCVFVSVCEWEPRVLVQLKSNKHKNQRNIRQLSLTSDANNDFLVWWQWWHNGIVVVLLWHELAVIQNRTEQLTTEIWIGVIPLGAAGWVWPNLSSLCLPTCKQCRVAEPEADYSNLTQPSRATAHTQKHTYRMHLALICLTSSQPSASNGNCINGRVPVVTSCYSPSRFDNKVP